MLLRTRAVYDLHDGERNTSSVRPVAVPILLALQYKQQIAAIQHLSFQPRCAESLFCQSGALLCEQKEPFVGIR